MVLSGLINKEIVKNINDAGGKAIGSQVKTEVIIAKGFGEWR
jgi:acetylglutamate kinase